MSALSREKTLSVPVPLPSRTGELVVTVDIDGPQHATLMSWLPGQLLGRRLGISRRHRLRHRSRRRGVRASAAGGRRFDVASAAVFDRNDAIRPSATRICTPTSTVSPPSQAYSHHHVVVVRGVVMWISSRS